MNCREQDIFSGGFEVYIIVDFPGFGLGFALQLASDCSTAAQALNVDGWQPAHAVANFSGEFV